MEAPEAPFRFQFQLSYDDVVEEKLYAIDTQGVQLQHHALQRKSATSYFCLLCRGPVPKIEKQVLADHFDHHKVKKPAEDALDAYHEAFLKLDNAYQMQQVFYLPLMANKVECQVCHKQIPIGNVLSHCNGIDHAANAKKRARDYWPEALGSINETALAAKLERLTLQEVHPPDAPNAVQKKSLVFTNSSRSRESRENREKSKSSESDEDVALYTKLFYYKCNNFNFCVLCQAAVTQESYAEHLAAVKHKKAQQSPIYKGAKQFQATWSAKYAGLEKIYKKYFIPVDPKNCKCLICNRKLLLSKVAHHIKSLPCAIIKETSRIYNVEIDFRKKREVLLETRPVLPAYSEEVIKRFYSPLDLFELARKGSGLPVETMQRREHDGEEYLFCLLCQCRIVLLIGVDAAALRTVKQHVTQATHVLNEYRKTKITFLYNYHRYFANAEEKVQMLQGGVNILKHSYECALCHESFHISAFGAHVNACKFYNVKIEDAAVAGTSEVAKPDKVKALEVTSLTFVEVVVPHVGTQLESLCYEDDTLIKLYPTCNTPRGQRRPDILTMQMRSEFDKYCLACGCSVYTRGMDHISSERHFEAVTARRVALRAYHVFWMSQTPAVQLHQVYFNPQSERSLKCIGCYRKVAFDAMHKHGKCTDWIKQRNAECIVPEEFAPFELNYEGSIVRRYFYGPQYDLSRDILGTHMPIVYVCKRYFFCLLCYDKKGVFIRDVERWRSHLYKFHCTPNNKRVEQLRRVLEFHQFWAAQPTEQQSYLSHFTLLPSGVVCELGHCVQLQEAVEHIEGDTCLLRKHLDEDKQQREMQDGAQANGDNPNGTKAKKHTIVPIYPDTDTDVDAANGNENDSPQDAINGNKGIKLPVYFKQHEAFFTLIGNSDVHCTVCELSMRNDPVTLRHHIGSDLHGNKAKKSTKRINVIYNCDVCMQKLRSERNWLTHLESVSHQKMVQSMPEIRRTDMKEFYCTGCNWVIFGDKVSLIRHDVGGERNTKKQSNNLTASMKSLLKTREQINAMAKELHEKCALFQQESQGKVEQCISDLEALVRQIYPKCKIYQFGSRVSGFVFEDSDLDLFVDVDDKYFGPSLDYHGERKIVLEVSKLLKLDPKTYVDLHTVPSARVPIAKVVHAPTELDCDLSFINGLSVENSRLIRFYTDLQPVFGEAMLVLKEWGYRMSCKLKNDMTSYALCMMVIFSMQLDGYLPSVQKLRELSTFEVPNITGWDTICYDKLDKDALIASLKQPTCVADVVLGFFKFYGFGFQYSKLVVCPMLGRTFPVKLFENKGLNTPPEMHTYRDKVAVDPDAQFRVSGANIFVQDPFDLGHNLTKLANKRFVNTFEKLCRLSHGHVLGQ